MAASRLVSTPSGDAALLVNRAKAPATTLVLGHGAGGGCDARDLAALAAELPSRGITVVRVEQPWRVQGRRVAPAPKALDEAFLAAVRRLRPRTPLVVGGRSAGARVACRTARLLGAAGCLALSFPLHPPGRPASSRLPELEASGVPTLVVQGERDAFGAPDEFPSGVQVIAVPSADHGFAVPKSAELGQEETLELIVEAVLEWVTREVG
jgi:uncharacterized protein